MVFSTYDARTDIIKQLPDDPNDSGGLNAAQLKSKFDENALNIKNYINDSLVAELNSATSGSSGADNLGYGGDILSVSTVKGAIDLLYAAGLGTIPEDGAISTVKLADGAVTLDKLASDVKAEMDRIEERIEDNFHDDYINRLELYYSDLLDDNIEYSAMYFDGLLDSDNIDSTNTTVCHSTTYGIVQSTYSTSSYITPSGLSLVNGVRWSGIQDNMSNAIDGSETTRADMSEGRTSVVQLTLSEIKEISGFKVLEDKGDYGSIKLYNAIFSEDGITWRTGTESTHYFSEDKTWITIDFSRTVKAKYIRFTTTVSSSDNHSIGGNIYEITVITTTPNNNTHFQSLIKTTTDMITKAKLYISVKEHGNAMVTPTLTADGTNYEALTLVESNTDQLDSYYTEKEYEVEFVNTGTSLGLRAVFTADGTNFAEFNKYCIIFE